MLIKPDWIRKLGFRNCNVSDLDLATFMFLQGVFCVYFIVMKFCVVGVM